MKTLIAEGSAHRAVPQAFLPLSTSARDPRIPRGRQPHPALDPIAKIPAVGAWGEVQQAPWLGLLGF